MMIGNDFLPLMLLATLAGLATGIGGAAAFFAKRTNTALLAVALGFSGGVMLYISFVELLASSNQYFAAHFAHGGLISTGLFFGGILLSLAIDRLVPSDENPHEIHKVEEMANAPVGIKRTGIMLAVVITIHNFPEGMAVVGAGMKSLSLGIPIAIAIALHNIPEGIAVSLPLYYATGNRKKAFFYSILSGLAEPVGALIGYLVLKPFLTETLLNGLFAAIAGIMIFITFDELLPLAERYGEHHKVLYGLIAGMLFMAAVMA